MPQIIPQPNINYLFQDQIPNFAHLVTTEPQTKEQLMKAVKDTYSLDNPKTALFYGAIERSSFETIRINDERTTILFNQ